MISGIDKNPFAVRDEDGSFVRVALELAQKRRPALPCRLDGSPYVAGCHSATTDPDIIRSWGRKWPDAEVGLYCAASGLVVVVVNDEPAWQEYQQKFELDFPSTTTAVTANGVRSFFLRARAGATYPGQLCDGVDVVHEGHVNVPKPKGYSECEVGRWETKVALADAPEWLENPPHDKELDMADTVATKSAIPVMRDLLEHIDPDESDQQSDWVLMNVYRATNGSTEGRRLAEEWSRKGSEYVPGDLNRRWSSFRRDLTGGVPVIASIASWRGADLEEIAVRHGYSGRAELLQGKRAAPFGSEGVSDKVVQLLQIASEADLFHTPDGVAMADIWADGHRVTLAVNSKQFRQWLGGELFKRSRQSARSEAMTTAVDLCEALAQHEGEEHPVFLRVGMLNGRIYVDLCDEQWRAIEIDKNGWRVVRLPPIRFRRALQMKALPDPVRGGSIRELRDILNVSSDSDFVLLVGWLLQCFRPTGPYHAMIVSGEQGSAKSTFCRIMRTILDPHDVAVRSPPRNEEDLYVGSNNTFIMAFDNLSGLTNVMSDALCRLLTGGAFATRKFYTNDEEATLKAERPVMINGIGTIVHRADLIDRSLFVSLARIDGNSRLELSVLMEKFEDMWPRILGALLDAVSVGLRRSKDVRLKKMPRMADCARWITACEGHFWDEGTFLMAAEAAHVLANEEAVDGDPVASAIRRMLDGRTDWTGTMTQLLDELDYMLGEARRHLPYWPKNAAQLGTAVERCAPALLAVGIEITTIRGSTSNRDRVRYIRKVPSKLSSPSEEDSVEKSLSKPSKPSSLRDFPSKLDLTGLHDF